MKKKLILPGLLAVATLFMMSNQGGVTGKSTSGCDCHGSASSATTVIAGITQIDYTPGKTYNIQVVIQNSSLSKAGFNLTVDKGTLAATGSNTQLIAGEATHTSPKSMTSGVAIFNLDWTAPATGSGKVTFNVAGMAANGDGTNSGDAYALYSTSYDEEVSSVKDFILESVDLYPSLADKELHLKTDLKISDISIISVTGQRVQAAQISSTKGLTFDVSSLLPGVYFVSFAHEGNSYTLPFTKR